MSLPPVKSLLLGCLLLCPLRAAEVVRVTYLRDVAPILNKTGCTSGPCHGAAKGKNGFKLSLRGYDPRFDYEALLYDLSGRRFNRADPARSLMLAKPTQQVPHGGGLRFDATSPYYKTIAAWISQGVPYGSVDTDVPVSLAVEPAEVFLPKPGENVALQVTAKFGDNTSRNVTAESVIESNTPDVAAIDNTKVKAVRIGEAALLVRYQGKFVTIPVTVVNPKPGFSWQALPQHNFIDQMIDAKLQRLKIQPSPVVDDATYLRRVSIDLTGQVPTPEQVRNFLVDRTATKRAKLVDQLIGSPAFVDHWTLKLADLLQNSRKYLGEKGSYAFQDWIRQSVADNKPYDKFVHEILTSRGSSYDNPEANFFRVTRDAKPTMEKTTQVFLGVRMVCTQCHDHPFERWTQNQYYEMASFFAGVGVRPGFEVGEEIIYDQRSDFEMKHPKDGRVMKPNFLVAATVAGVAPISIPSDGRRREALADWLVAKENPFFAKSTANRVWSYFFGKGIIDPVDDIRASNPPSNPALLDALTKDFIGHQFDLRNLMRTIVTSRIYQSTIATNEWNATDSNNFSHAVPRRLTAEELMDALTVATGVRPALPDVPPDTKAEQVVDPHVGKEGFLDLFGRPARESACECERRAELSLPQALNLVNGKTISDAVADSHGRIAKAVLAGKSDRDLIEEMYMASLNRPATPNEMALALKYVQAPETSTPSSSRTMRAQDLMWALVNSKAFLYNR